MERTWKRICLSQRVRHDRTTKCTPAYILHAVAQYFLIFWIWHLQVSRISRIKQYLRHHLILTLKEKFNFSSKSEGRPRAERRHWTCGAFWPLHGTVWELRIGEQGWLGLQSWQLSSNTWQTGLISSLGPRGLCCSGSPWSQQPAPRSLAPGGMLTLGLKQTQKRRGCVGVRNSQGQIRR